MLVNSCKKDAVKPQPLSDMDGNVYHSVTIGTQEWMVENLRVTKFKDGMAISLARENTSWENLGTGSGYCWYNNDEATYKNPYGALYNWYAVSTGKLCPSGWHVPSSNEMKTLTTYLGGSNVAGIKLKESGAGHWLSSSNEGTNESGFTAVPGGLRFGGGVYFLNGTDCWYWSTTDFTALSSVGLYITYNAGYAYTVEDYNNLGLSVRCVKD